MSAPRFDTDDGDDAALPDLAAVERAAERLRPHLLRTPTLPCAWLGERAGAEVWVKWESLQATGSFKLRGALHKLLVLGEQGARRVLAVSAGNHGLGVARAARLCGMTATVVVPEGAAPTKVAAIRREGAELVVRGAGYDEAEAEARALARARGVPFVSPYNDADVIAGQGTVALELLADAPPLDLVLVPVGGGGLAAGVALVAAARGGGPVIAGAQPVHAPAMARALEAGRLVPVVESPTLADGLAGNVEPGAITFPLVRRHVRAVELVAEASIEAAIRGFATHDHHIVEGSGAVGAAAILEGLRPDLTPAPPRRIGLVVTGRNLDVERLTAILDRGRGRGRPASDTEPAR